MPFKAENYGVYSFMNAGGSSLAPLGTSWEKPYLEIVPWIVVVFEELYEVLPDGGKRKNYYPKESVGISCGFFIAAPPRFLAPYPTA